MKLENKKVIVIGTGKSGIGAVKLLKSYKAEVILWDSNEKLDICEIQKKVDVGIHVVIGSIDQDILVATDLAVVSPGVPMESPIILELEALNIPVIGEIELAYRCSKGKIAAITGTNGKTTTTSLVGEIMNAYYKSAFVVGNIGNPYSEIVENTTIDSVITAEISSFQLESTQMFHPFVSAVLNITPDHLDRHHTMENYSKIKFDITKAQTNEDFCVLNYEDEIIREKVKDLCPQVCFFSSKRELEKGIYLTKGNDIIYHDGKSKTKVLKTTELNLLGIHNYENVMAAILIAIHMCVPMNIIQRVCKNFKAVEHRIEFVCEKKGVKFYNDSKGTNPDAAIRGIKAMQSPTMLIAGGYDKNADFTQWIQAFDGKVKLFVLIGQTKEKIYEAAVKCGFKNTVLADSLEEAVQICYQNANKGDSILLSPACASWGMFKNYEERGIIFKELVRSL